MNPVVFIAFVWILIGLVVAAAARVRSTARLGQSLGAYGRRRIGVQAGALLGLGVVSCMYGERVELALFAFVLAYLWLAPGESERAYGLKGASFAWRSVRYADAEEWRLAGEHLRLLVHDEWSAVRVRPEHLETLQAELERIAPERRSRIGTGT